MGPEILSSTGAGVWRKAPMAFPDSSSGPGKISVCEKHPSRDVIFLAKTRNKIITLFDVVDPIKQAFLASRDVLISSQDLRL